MAGSLNEIKNKIASTKKTSQITGAMQMVSAAKLAKSEQAAKSFQIYADKVRNITTDLLRAELMKGSTNPMLIRREEIKKTGYIVITSDSGLKGAYNSTILKAVMGMIDQDHTSKDEFEIIAIGGMGADFFKNRGMTPIFELRGIADNPNFEEVQKIIYKSVEMYKNEIFDELYVCYNHHVNSLTSQVRVQQMLPIEDLDHNEADGYTASFELEPSRSAILEQLLPQYAESMIYGALLDAKTAESAAGMTAMQTATDNAKNVISDLTIQYNRARQAAITQEITEIVAGASALE
ncbi:F0F1 ATP synthase subunit gamma [Streptococcus gallolyticus]|nr:F0F1 ATP synthase subunit gamma [Streptococcus gallolyticus]MBY5041157.1 F0F1 ATP synthase subunit gamma [Streptococcus gallolyticus]